nr:hypothetical protein [Tanacetum cinerariifolium]
MSMMANTTPIVTTVMKTANKEKTPKEADATLKANILDFCEEHYEDILPVIMDKICHDKRKEIHARLDFEENPRKSRRVREDSQNSSVGILREEGGSNPCYLACRRAAPAMRDTGKTKAKRRKPADKEDLSVPWTCEDVDPFTPRIRNFKSSRKTRMPNNMKTYNGTGDLKDHLKIFQAAAQVERWAMPTWCHMFNSTLIGAARVLFDELPPESIDGYKGLKAAFLAYFMQQKKYVKDLVEIHNIKQRDEETIEEFIERFKFETRRMEGAPECMRISGFMHGVNNSELTKRLNERVPTTMEEMMTATKAFIRGETTIASKKKKVSQSFAHIKEITFPPLTANKGTEGPLVIEAEIGGYAIRCVYVDGGSSMEVLYKHCFNRLRPKIKNQMVPATTSLTGFSGETIWPLGHLRLLVTIGDTKNYTKAWMNFMIVRSLSPYNYIIGRPGIREIQALPSMTHRMLKFSVNGRIVSIRSTILTPTECTTIVTTLKQTVKKAEARHRKFKVPIHPHFSDQEITVRGTAKKRGQAPKRAKAIQLEVQKLVEAGILREVYYHDWLSNPVMVKKHDGSWSMLSSNTDGQKNDEKTAFHTSHWVYCYTKMPFGLKNAGATYQRLVDKAFDREIGRNLEIYVENLVIKSHTETKLLQDIEEMFRMLRHINMKLNPKKCTFGAAEEMFQGYMINSEGIKLCPDKTKAVLQLSSPRTIKEVQSLNGKLASLNRFISKISRKIFATLQNLEEFGFDDRKGHNLDTGLFCEPSVAGSRAKLYPNGKASPGTGLRNQKVTQTLPGASHRGHHRPAHQASQILADFLVEKPNDAPPEASVIKTPQELWTLFTDGSSCVDGSSAGLILTCPEGTEFTHALRFQFTASNNEAEYEALIAGLRIAAQMGVRNVHVSVDSKLVANQVLGTYVAKEENMINMHVGPRSVVAKAMRYGYYWPTMHQDAQEMIHKCKNCQIHRLMPSDDQFKDWCEKLNMVQHFALVKHPQSNGLIERENRSLGEGIKAQLGEGNKNWLEELPHVLWAHRTMIKLSNDDTLFSLTYGTEAVIPAEIRMPTYRTAIVDAVHNDEELRLNLDLLEERRERATIREAKAKSKMRKYYNVRVRGVTFRPRDFVYRSNDAIHAMDGRKLGPKWEGPYEVTKALGVRAYKLRSIDGTVLLRTWNIANLKKCYL